MTKKSTNLLGYKTTDSGSEWSKKVIFDKRPPFKFDKRKLLKELNGLLKNNNVAKKKLFDKTAWILTSKEFANILGIA